MPQKSNTKFVRATLGQVPAIKLIADSNRDEIGFLNSAKILQVIKEDRIIVAAIRVQVVGFVIFRHRKTDTQTTLSEICIDRNLRGHGYGRGLINALYQDSISHCHTFIRLKCPIDLAANSFYKHVGFQRVGTEPGKIRQLNIWELS